MKIAAALIAGLLATNPLWAGPVEDAMLRTHQARLVLQRAEQRLDQARDRVDTIRRELDQAADRLRELPRLIEQLKQRVADLRRSASEADLALAEAVGELENARRQERFSTELSEQSRRDLESAEGLVLDIRSQRVRTFEATPQFIETQDRAKAAEGAEADAVAACLARLERDRQYVSLRDDAAAKEKRVQALRLDSGVPPTVLADVSRSWIEAKSRFEAARRAAIDSDADVREARRRHKEAADALAALRADFEKRLMAEPEMAQASARRDQAKAALDKALTDQKSAKAAIAQQERRIAELRGRMAAAEQGGQAALSQIGQLEGEQSRRNETAANAERALRTALTEERIASVERDEAARRLRLAIEEEERIRRQQPR